MLKYSLCKAESFNIIAIPKLKLESKFNLNNQSICSASIQSPNWVEKYIETISQLKKLLEFSDRVIEKYKGEFAEVKSFLVQINNKIFDIHQSSPKQYIEAVKNYRRMIKQIHENMFKLTKILQKKVNGNPIQEKQENLFLIKDEFFVNKNFWSDKEEVITLFKVQKEFVKSLYNLVNNK